MASAPFRAIRIGEALDADIFVRQAVQQVRVNYAVTVISAFTANIFYTGRLRCVAVTVVKALKAAAVFPVVRVAFILRGAIPVCVASLHAFIFDTDCPHRAMRVFHARHTQTGFCVAIRSFKKTGAIAIAVTQEYAFMVQANFAGVAVGIGYTFPANTVRRGACVANHPVGAVSVGLAAGNADFANTDITYFAIAGRIAGRAFRNTHTDVRAFFAVIANAAIPAAAVGAAILALTVRLAGLINTNAVFTCPAVIADSANPPAAVRTAFFGTAIGRAVFYTFARSCTYLTLKAAAVKGAGVAIFAVNIVMKVLIIKHFQTN